VKSLDLFKGEISKFCWSEMQETGTYSRLYFGIMAQTDSYISLPTCLAVTYDVNLTFQDG